jgi:hypothetical protein
VIERERECEREREREIETKRERVKRDRGRVKKVTRGRKRWPRSNCRKFSCHINGEVNVAWVGCWLLATEVDIHKWH